jgi:tetratricopeptide (TPR) repeat protein
LKAFGSYHLTVIDALRGQAYSERALRNFDAALQLLGQLEATAEKTRGVDARMIPGLARDRANLLLAAGRWSESLDQAVVALPICVRDLGSNHSECRELMFCKVNAMLRLGMTLRAAEDLSSLQVIADDRKSPALGADTLLLILKLESAAGTADREMVAFERVRSLVELDAGGTLSPNIRTKAFLALAETRLRKNDPVDGERWVEKALAIQRRDDGSLPASLSVAIAKDLSGVALSQAGRTAEALEILRAAQDDVAKLFGVDDPMTRLISLNTALALEALGRSTEALGIVERAEPVLRRAMGRDAPAYLQVKELQNRLLERKVALGMPSPQGVDPASAKNRIGKLPAIDFFN